MQIVFTDGFGSFQFQSVFERQGIYTYQLNDFIQLRFFLKQSQRFLTQFRKFL